jgi:hypothetical protein
MRFPFHTIIFAVVMVGCFFVFTWMHEKVHQSIYESYGAESKIELFSLEHPFEAVTIATLNNRSQCPTDTCEMQQNMVENVGYQIQPLLVLFGFGFFVVIYFLERMVQQQQKFQDLLLGKEKSDE